MRIKEYEDIVTSFSNIEFVVQVTMHTPPNLCSQNAVLKVEFTEKVVEVDPTDSEYTVSEIVLTQPERFATEDLDW